METRPELVTMKDLELTIERAFGNTAWRPIAVDELVKLCPHYPGHIGLALHRFIENQMSIDLLGKLVDAGADCDIIPDEYGYPILCQVIRHQYQHEVGYSELIEKLISKTNSDNKSLALTVAARFGQIDVMERLLSQQDVDIDYKDKNQSREGHTALSATITELDNFYKQGSPFTQGGELDAVKLLISRGPRKMTYGKTDSHSILSYLVDTQNTAYFLTTSFSAPDTQAAKESYFRGVFRDLALMLLDSEYFNDFEGLDVVIRPENAGPFTLLTQIMSIGDEVLDGRSRELTHKLINKGVDVNQPIEGDAPLELAIRNGWYDVVERLVDKGADITYNGRGSALIDIMKTGREGLDGKARELTKLIIKEYIGPDAFAGWFPPLHYAAMNGWVDIVEELVSNGAKIILSKSAVTTLMGNVLEKYELQQEEQIGERTAIVKLLIDAGAQVKEGAEGFDLLQGAGLDYQYYPQIQEADADLHALLIISRACQTGSMKDFKSFLDIIDSLQNDELFYGENPSTHDRRTAGINYKQGLPLYYAIKNKQLKIALELISYGCETNIDAHLDASFKRDDSFMNMVRFAADSFGYETLLNSSEETEFVPADIDEKIANNPKFIIDVLKACKRGDAIRLQKWIEREYDPKDYSIWVRIKESFIAAFRYIVSLFTFTKKKGIEGGVGANSGKPVSADGLQGGSGPAPTDGLSAQGGNKREPEPGSGP